MNILDGKDYIALSVFGAEFGKIIRHKAKKLRMGDCSVADYHGAYAKCIFETYQNVHDVATITGTRPTQRILKALELIELPQFETCKECGNSAISYIYVSQDYEETS